MVIEGSIEDGQQPQVLLSLTAPYFTNIDSSNLMEYRVTGAKVTVRESGSGHEEILILNPNKVYFPPYVYLGNLLMGKQGETYQLIVEYGGHLFTASTTIPDPIMPDSVWFEIDQDNDSTGRIFVSLTDTTAEDKYFRILFQRRNKDTRFIPPLGSVFSTSIFKGSSITLSYKRALKSILDVVRDDYFLLGDTIDIKFCTITKEQYEFWSNYQQEVINSANPFSSGHKATSHQFYNAYGIWGGYSAKYYTLIAK
jgi:hypothetical protein